ncbi:hypothetical protein vseg_000371 [Gypsophila vaccaria]
MENNVGKRFMGKVAIVTGSTQGIGYAIALRLGLEGASVVVSSRKQSNVDEATEKLERQGIAVLGVVCHVSIASQRKNLVDQTIQKFGRVDVIIFNAAVNPTPDTIINTKEPALDKLWDVNVKASVLLLQDAAPHLSAGSSIIFISTIAVYRPFPLATMYGVTKTALLGLTKALAIELAPNTRVNCISSGFVPTHFSEVFQRNETIIKMIEDGTPLKRYGTTEDIAAAAAFLASNDASYITGETLVVAGGMHSRL